MSLRAAVVPILLPVAAAIIVAACGLGEGNAACFESGAVAYQVHAPGDTAVVFRWPRSFHPLRVYAEPVGQLQANVDASISLWHNALRCDEVSMQRVSDSATADIVVRNPSAMPPLPTRGASLAADSVGACNGRTDLLLDSLNRLERPLRVYVTPFNIDTVAVNGCYRFVTAHEIGHTLGLFSHSGDAADIMNSTPRRRLLTVNDRYTLQLLYHLPSVSIQPVPR